MWSSVCNLSSRKLVFLGTLAFFLLLNLGMYYVILRNGSTGHFSVSQLEYMDRTFTVNDHTAPHKVSSEGELCPRVPRVQVGPIDVQPVDHGTTLEVITLDNKWVLPGGAWRPKHCVARMRVAILVPYRDRFSHLKVFLQHMHPFLRNQNLDYTIFLIEQVRGSRFSRGGLFNAGFLEITKRFSNYFQCFILHDVDLLPLDDRIIYNCSVQPRHLSGRIDIFDYELPYNENTGGALEITAELFRQANGFSNIYFGWGGEDDDFTQRLEDRKVNVTRYPEWGRYTMIRHTKAIRNRQRQMFLKSTSKRSSIDGLNTILYKVHGYRQFPLFTNIEIAFNEKQTIGEFILRAWRHKMDLKWLQPMATYLRIPLEPRG